VPIFRDHGVRSVRPEIGEPFRLDFGVAATDFQVILYEEDGGDDPHGTGIPKMYEARLHFTDAMEEPGEWVRVNQPVAHGGWLFYLQSYDQMARRFVVLKARRDPGRYPVFTGMWLMIVGVAILCFRRKGSAVS